METSANAKSMAIVASKGTRGLKTKACINQNSARLDGRGLSLPQSFGAFADVNHTHHLPAIAPSDVKEMLKAGTAVLVDVRESDERARVYIADTVSAPLSRLEDALAGLDRSQTVVFHCASGNRTEFESRRLAATGFKTSFALEGGLDAWHRENLNLVIGKGNVLPVMRQVQITAGSLVLTGVVLGYTVSPWCFALSGFIGAGLVLAGASGWCGMANVLARMPWNRTAVTA